MSTSLPELMTLAGIAYGYPDDIPRYLDEDPLTRGNWEVAWIAAAEDVPVNFAFAARDRRNGGYVIAIRGTYPNPLSSAYWEDGHQDSPFGSMAAWPSGEPRDPGGDGPQVSGGTWAGFSGVIALKDDAGRTLAQAIDAWSAQAPITVTGHSLGGTLAPVLALWLTETQPGRSVDVATFAGMTPGNGAFAALFGPGTPLDGRVTRCYNTLDSVPYGWNDVLATRDFFEPTPRGGVVVDVLLHTTAWRLRHYDYTAIGKPVPLTGQVVPPTISCTLVAFAIETLHQHMPDTYLKLLGAPPLPFSIVFSAVVAPRSEQSVNAAAGQSQQVAPVYVR